VRKNLRNSFPEKSQAELLSIEKQFYINLCDYGVETLKLLTMRKEDLASRVTFTNLDLIQSYKEKNEPLILLSAHLFNWEWILTAGSFSLPIPLDFVYQKVESNLFNTFAMVTRTRFGAFPIERSNVARETIKRKNVLRGIALVSDQYPGYKKDKKHPAFFLNQESVLFLGGNQLAILMQYPVLYMNVRKIKRGHYEGTFEKIAEPPFMKDDVTVVDNYVRALEDSIRKDPANWLWSHNRWKKRHLGHGARQAE
jgi:Kdo2-lipid IVA lauroyltransferase/acyltransferase